jgi:hypothetical protein
MSTYQKDLLERVVRTFLAVFLGAALAAAPDGGITLDIAQQAAMAGLAAVLTLILGIVSKPVGDTDSAGVLT